MSDHKKVYRAPAWHTTIFVIFGAVLLGIGVYLSWLSFQGRNQTIGLLLFFLLFLPITLAGAYFIYSAFRHKVIVENDKVTVYEGAFGEKSFNKSQVDGFVRRGSNQMLEFGVVEEQEKTTIQTAVAVDESLRQELYLNKELPQYKQTDFKVSNYPITLDYSLESRILNWVFILSFNAFVFYPVFTIDVASVLDKANNTQDLIFLCCVLAIFPITFLAPFFIRYRILFNLGVTIYHDKLEVEGIISKKVIMRNSITYFAHRHGHSFRPRMVQISTEPNANYFSKAYYLKTFGEFEKEPLFVDWFNSLQVPTDMEIPRIRQEY